MTDNEMSLISHALKLYGVQYDDNLKLGYCKSITSNAGFIEVVDPNIQNSIILRVYDWVGGFDMQMYKNRNTTLKLNNNIRSFIKHWSRCYNVNKTINRVAVWKCSHNKFDIAILCDDNRWYLVLVNMHPWYDGWIVYNW